MTYANNFSFFYLKLEKCWKKFIFSRENAISDNEQIRITDYEKLYQKELSKMNKKGASNRHRKAAESASDELKKTRGNVMQ